jgi:hypothetical protein
VHFHRARRSKKKHPRQSRVKLKLFVSHRPFWSKNIAQRDQHTCTSVTMSQPTGLLVSQPQGLLRVGGSLWTVSHSSRSSSSSSVLYSTKESRHGQCHNQRGSSGSVSQPSLVMDSVTTKKDCHRKYYNQREGLI